MLTINQVANESHQTAKEKGWWDEPRTIAHQIGMIHSEISEALEEARDAVDLSALASIRYREDGKPEGFGIEMADAIIRIADTCAHLGIDLAECLAVKMAFNKKRPYKHGRQF